MYPNITEYRPATQEEIMSITEFPITHVNNQAYKVAYGKHFPSHLSDAQIEMWCAGNRLRVEQGGLGEFGHFKKLLQILYPHLRTEWHHWMDMQIELLTNGDGT